MSYYTCCREDGEKYMCASKSDLLPVLFYFFLVFKLLLTCYKALNDVGPLCIKDLLPLAKDKGKGLRSSKDPLLLEDPRTHRATCGDRSFSAAGPREWNNLPLSIRQSPTVSYFISALKTRLFKIAYKCQ